MDRHCFWTCIVAGCLVNSLDAAAHDPEISIPMGGTGSLPAFQAATLGAVVRDSEYIALWHVVEYPESMRMRLRVVRVLKGSPRHAGYSAAAAVERTDSVAADEVQWQAIGREAVVFVKDGAALICFGTTWFGMTFDEPKNYWKSTYACESLSTLYYGSVDVLVERVREIIAGREVVVVAERPTFRFYGCDGRASIEHGSLWRIKASLKIDAAPISVHSANFVGLGGCPQSELPRAIARLEDRAAWVRSLALDDIASLGKEAKDALPALYNRFTDPLPSLRIRAACIALKIDPSVNLPLLAIIHELQKCEDWDVRQQAAQVLGELAELTQSKQHLVPFLLAGFECDPDKSVRRACADALDGSWKHALPMLPKLLERFECEQHPYDAETVARLGQIAAHADKDTRQRLAQRIARKVRSSDEEEGHFRSNAIFALYQLGPDMQPAIPTLRYLILKKAHVEEAVRTLIEFDPDSVAWLAKRLTHPASDPKEIIEALSEAGAKARAALPELRRLLDDKRIYVRYFTALALLKIDPSGERKRAHEALSRIVAEASHRGGYGGSASFHLRQMGLPAVGYSMSADERSLNRYQMMKTIRDPSARNRSEVLADLANYGPEARELVPELWQMMKADQTSFRAELIAALWKIDAPSEHGAFTRDSRARLIEALRNMLSDPRFDSYDFLRVVIKIGPAGAPLVSEVRKLLNSPGHCSQAIWALHAIGPSAKDAIPDIVRFLNVDDWSIQKAAIAALCRVSRGQMGVERLVEWCETMSFRILLSIEPTDLGGKNINALLREAIRNSDPEVREHATQLLRATNIEALKDSR